MRKLLVLITSIALGAGAPMMAKGQPRANPRSAGPVKSGFVRVNGLRMYYELHGAGGTPLVLIHGGGSTIGTNFGRVLPQLSRSRRVIAVEVQESTPPVRR